MEIMEHHGEKLEIIIFALSKGGNWMKKNRPSKPTRNQKELIKRAGYSWENWLVTSEDNLVLTIMNKMTGTQKRIKK